jgi:hypothetical protein
MSVPPPPITSLPPESIVVGSARPRRRTRPPELTTVPDCTALFCTSSVPPFNTTVPLPTPPFSTTCEPAKMVAPLARP